MKQFFFVLLFLSLLLVMGCGSNIKLSGKVVFSDDGSPVSSGTVCFVDGPFMARGDIRPDGTFDVGSLGVKGGLPPGTYNVYFVDTHKEVGHHEGVSITEPLIAPKYESPLTSELTFTVDGSTRTVEFSLERASERRR